MASKRKSKIVVANTDPFLPKFLSESSTNTRGRGTGTNQSTYSDLSGELDNISRGVAPFGKDSAGSIGVNDAICLCQKAYYNIPIFRNTIDIQTEFANSHLHFRGKNKRSVAFYNEWYKKIGGWSFAERFFREWFRSGNVFVYKFLYEASLKELNKMSRAEALNKISEAEVMKKIPMKYTILNPADMRCEGAASFINAVYHKMLNEYELARLKVPKTDEEVKFLESLPTKIQQQIKKGEKPTIPIEPQYLVAVFCGKQDYEAMAVPMYYSVLFDIDLKLEFKKMEKVISRTTDYMILLITAGEKDRDSQINSRVLGELQTLFEQESVGRVLVSDYTTKAEFVIPELNKILGSEKYKVVNEDIANGLMNIFWGEEKFANSMVKIKVFLERLRSARDAYLNGFLKNEMEAIAKEMGFTEIPEPVFDEVDLKEEIEYMKVYTRLAELGILTPEELFDAVESHGLPLKENSKLSQEEFKKMKDKGLYEPLIGGQKKEEGRPAGSKAPQTTKKVSPIGASKFSLQKISDNIKIANELLEKVESQYRQTKNIKRMSGKEKDICWNTTESIIASKPISEWENSITEFLENPIQIPDQESLEISVDHNISLFLAGILRDSKS
jgi:hypothetical protein